MKLTIACVIVGAAIGCLLLASYCRGPGDPSGRSIGAGLGGFAGLMVGLFATAILNLFERK